MSESTDDVTIDDWPREIKMECTPTASCGRLTCAACSDPYRLRWIRQTLAITKAHPGQHEIATIVLLAIPPTIVDAKIIRRVLREVLAQVDFQGELLRGSLDVNWDSVLNTWILCAHVLAVDVPPDAWARLRARLRIAKPSYIEPSYRPSFLVKVQRLRDPERQIANLLRFHQYFWPRSLSGAARAVPLPADRLEGLAVWASRYAFKDFTFEFRKVQRES
jgi:adenylate kinase family enzyme